MPAIEFFRQMKSSTLWETRNSFVLWMLVQVSSPVGNRGVKTRHKRVVGTLLPPTCFDSST